MRYNWNDSETRNYFGIGNGQQNVIDYRPQFAKVTYTRTFSPNVLNEAGIGLNRLYTLPAPASDPEVLRAPQIIFGSGIPNAGPALWDLKVGNTSVTLLDTLSWVKGKHQLKFGGQIIRAHANKDTRFRRIIAFLGLGVEPGFFGANQPFLIQTLGSPTTGQRTTLTNSSRRMMCRSLVSSHLIWVCATSTTRARQRLRGEIRISTLLPANWIHSERLCSTPQKPISARALVLRGGRSLLGTLSSEAAMESSTPRSIRRWPSFNPR